jgi:hypothetical protein
MAGKAGQNRPHFTGERPVKSRRRRKLIGNMQNQGRFGEFMRLRRKALSAKPVSKYSELSKGFRLDGHEIPLKKEMEPIPKNKGIGPGPSHAPAQLLKF